MRIKKFVIVQEVNDATVLNEMNKYIIVNNIVTNTTVPVEETEESKKIKNFYGFFCAFANFYTIYKKI